MQAAEDLEDLLVVFGADADAVVAQEMTAHVRWPRVALPAS